MELQDDNFEVRLRRLYSRSIVNTDINAHTSTINISCLSRIRLHRLQKAVVKEALEFRYKPSDESTVSTTKVSAIQEYVQALKDHEFIRACALQGMEQDSFVLSSTRSYQKILIEECGKELSDELQNLPEFNETHPSYGYYAKIQSDLRLSEYSPPPQGSQNWDLFGGSRKVRNKKQAFENFLQRVGMAVLGGAFLIGPMQIMVLHPGEVSNLITKSVSVVLFGILVAAVLEKMFDVLSVTAAYAAVLVVFVGTSTGAATSGN